jgi:hypothetical protein
MRSGIVPQGRRVSEPLAQLVYGRGDLAIGRCATRRFRALSIPAGRHLHGRESHGRVGSCMHPTSSRPGPGRHGASTPGCTGSRTPPRRRPLPTIASPWRATPTTRHHWSQFSGESISSFSVLQDWSVQPQLSVLKEKIPRMPQAPKPATQIRTARTGPRLNPGRPSALPAQVVQTSSGGTGDAD